MRAVLVMSIAVIACGGSRTTPAVRPSASAPRDPAIAPAAPPTRTPPRGRPIPGIGPPGRTVTGYLPRDAWGRDEPRLPERPPVRPHASEAFFDKRIYFWSPCVRDFVETQPEDARETLGEALSLYSTTCTTDPGRRVEFHTPRTGRMAPAQSHLGLVGVLEPRSCELSLEVVYRGEPLHAERISLFADGVRWSSPRLDFEPSDGGETATLPFTRPLARVVARALDASETILRFEGRAGDEDVVVTDEMKQDLRVMIDALDAINRP